ncbi:hypothetical protein NEHOM01_0618 [Nematocida homosporus]|uniref:uncharacterized protein n=1 Tax=Nematocida homosporus TaxID=1912981 RepID=UPI00222018B0|nr:uncharacterized protein NEHOM01_0618 [Nematocida homosporus]KAI5185113.1 hypothetical protein NEHOM01_0618 [Nematocida homosporus]
MNQPQTAHLETDRPARTSSSSSEYSIINETTQPAQRTNPSPPPAYSERNSPGAPNTPPPQYIDENTPPQPGSSSLVSQPTSTAANPVTTTAAANRIATVNTAPNSANITTSRSLGASYPSLIPEPTNDELMQVLANQVSNWGLPPTYAESVGTATGTVRSERDSNIIPVHNRPNRSLYPALQAADFVLPAPPSYEQCLRNPTIQVPHSGVLPTTHPSGPNRPHHSNHHHHHNHPKRHILNNKSCTFFKGYFRTIAYYTPLYLGGMFLMKGIFCHIYSVVTANPSNAFPNGINQSPVLLLLVCCVGAVLLCALLSYWVLQFLVGKFQYANHISILKHKTHFPARTRAIILATNIFILVTVYRCLGTSKATIFTYLLQNDVFAYILLVIYGLLILSSLFNIGVNSFTKTTRDSSRVALDSIPNYSFLSSLAYLLIAVICVILFYDLLLGVVGAQNISVFTKY